MKTETKHWLIFVFMVFSVATVGWLVSTMPGMPDIVVTCFRLGILTFVICSVSYIWMVGD